MVTKIAYLTPFFVNTRSVFVEKAPYLVNLARGIVEDARGTYAVECLAYSDVPTRETLSPGVALRLLPAVRAAAHSEEVLSWELPAALADADLVHIHQLFT